MDRADAGSRPDRPDLARAGRLPDLLVIGCIRGGTTTLYRYLAAHPDVFMARGKELHYFDRDRERDVGWYTNQFEDAGASQLAGEATPNYINHQHALRGIGELLPDAALILSLRDPVDRLYSHYWMARERGRERRDLDDVVRDELADPATSVFLHASRYTERLADLRALLPGHRVHIATVEELKQDPGATSAQLFHFLGLPPLDAELPKSSNRFVGIRSTRVRAIGKTRRVPRPMRKIINRANTTKRRSYPPLDDTVRRRLERELVAEYTELGELLGRPVPWSRRTED